MKEQNQQNHSDNHLKLFVTCPLEVEKLVPLVVLYLCYQLPFFTNACMA